MSPTPRTHRPSFAQDALKDLLAPLQALHRQATHILEYTNQKEEENNNANAKEMNVRFLLEENSIILLMHQSLKEKLLTHDFHCKEHCGEKDLPVLEHLHLCLTCLLQSLHRHQTADLSFLEPLWQLVHNFEALRTPYSLEAVQKACLPLFSLEESLSFQCHFADALAFLLQLQKDIRWVQTSALHLQRIANEKMLILEQYIMHIESVKKEKQKKNNYVLWHLSLTRHEIHQPLQELIAALVHITRNIAQTSKKLEHLPRLQPQVESVKRLLPLDLQEKIGCMSKEWTSFCERLDRLAVTLK